MLTKSQSHLLNLYRGLSAQFVLFGHVFTQAHYPLKVTIQDLGVTVFFVLSGFLVTGSAIRTKEFSTFFIARLARMFTPYLPALCFILLVDWIFSLPGPHDVVTFLANALMLQDFPLFRFDYPLLSLEGVVPEIARLGTGRQLWSVSMEWWLYMAFGGIMFYNKLPKWAIPLVALGVIVAAFNAIGTMTYVWYAGAIAAANWGRVRKGPWIAIFFVLLGCIVYLHRKTPDEFHDLRIALMVSACILLSLKFLENLFWPEWCTKLAAGLAAYSYTLYLTHYTVMMALDGKLQGAANIALIIVCANLVAIILYFAFERHHKIVADFIRSATRRSAPIREV